MDNLTHTLTGLMLSRAGLNRWCPYATAILLAASNAPDVDVAVRFWGSSLDYLEHHRGYTHSLMFAPLVAAGGVAVVAGVLRKSFPWLRALCIATIGVLCHLLLDWTNTYGIRLLLPFSESWLRLDITNVVDVWIWAVLFLAVAGPLLSKLVSSEIGAKPGTGRGAAICALSFLVLYNGARFAVHERAVNTLNSHLYTGSAPRRVAAFPHFGNPFQWVGLVETTSSVILQRFNLLLPYDPAGGATHYLPETSPALEIARRTATAARFLRFSQFPFWQASPWDHPEGSMRVRIHDLRFGDPGAPRFVATVTVAATGEVIREEYGFGPIRPR